MVSASWYLCPFVVPSHTESAGVYGQETKVDMTVCDFHISHEGIAASTLVCRIPGYEKDSCHVVSTFKQPMKRSILGRT